MSAISVGHNKFFKLCRGLLLVCGVFLSLGAQTWAAVVCKQVYTQTSSPNERLMQIHRNLVDLGHEWRSFPEFLEFQEGIVRREFGGSLPDLKALHGSFVSQKFLDRIYSGYGALDLMKVLPLLISRQQVDGPEMVAELLRHSSILRKSIGESNYMRSISLWSAGPVGQANLATVVASAEDIHLNMLLQFASDKNALKDLYKRRLLSELEKSETNPMWPERNEKSPVFSADWYLKILANLPLQEIPNQIRTRMNDLWLKLDVYKPIVTDKVVTTNLGSSRYGGCCVRFQTFLLTLVHPFFRDLAPKQTAEGTESPVSFYSSDGDLALIQVDGKILGAVKFRGEDEGYSFLSLRNVINSEGRLVMAMGGVYALQTTFLDLVLKARDKQGRWAVVATDKLFVEPQSFLLNGSADHSIFTKEPNQSEDNPFLRPTDTGFREGWGNILMVLDQVRQRLERGERLSFRK